MNSIGEKALSKLPEVTLGFWIVKILATTLGETGGDAVTMSLNLGYWVGSAIFATVFALAVTDNLAEDLYRRLIVTYQKRGQLAGALEVYRRCRQMLSVVLGVGPSKETEVLYRTLKSG